MRYAFYPFLRPLEFGGFWRTLFAPSRPRERKPRNQAHTLCTVPRPKQFSTHTSCFPLWRCHVPFSVFTNYLPFRGSEKRHIGFTTLNWHHVFSGCFYCWSLLFWGSHESLIVWGFKKTQMGFADCKQALPPKKSPSPPKKSRSRFSLRVSTLSVFTVNSSRFEAHLYRASEEALRREGQYYLTRRLTNKDQILIAAIDFTFSQFNLRFRAHFNGTLPWIDKSRVSALNNFFTSLMSLRPFPPVSDADFLCFQKHLRSKLLGF